MSDAARIVEQLRNAFHGNAWHGPALLELLADIDPATAASHPLPETHSIWELVLHIAAWDEAVNRRIVERKALQLKGAHNFPPVKDKSSAAWKKTVARLKQTHAALIRTAADLSEKQLNTRVPGKKYNVRFMLDGVVQHELYHAGQIAILKKTRL